MSKIDSVPGKGRCFEQGDDVGVSALLPRPPSVQRGMGACNKAR